MVLSLTCVVCGSKRSKLTKEQEASGSFAGLLDVKSSFEWIPIIGNIV